MISKRRMILRAAAFVCILGILFFGMSRLFSQHPDPRIYQYVRGFYNEPEGTLQGVYIGSSNCYAFWNPLVAWRCYGLAVYPLATPAQPFQAAEHLIREARKTQPDAVFIVNLNSVEADDLRPYDAYGLLNYMPESRNKTALMNKLADHLGYDRLERLEFRFPWLRIREYWLTLLKNGLFPKLDGLKGAGYYSTYLNDSMDITGQYRHTDLRVALPDELAESTDHLLDYCDQEDVKVLFVVVPRVEFTDDALGRINALADRIRARGREVLALTDRWEELGLDLTRDYYNYNHTNIHGSIKFTRYISEYLVDRFGLEDRRGDSAYADWDEGWEKYWQIVAPYVQEDELKID